MTVQVIHHSHISAVSLCIREGIYKMTSGPEATEYSKPIVLEDQKQSILK